IVSDFNHMQNHEKRLPVFFDLGTLVPLAGILNRQFVQRKFRLHGFKLRWLGILYGDPNKAVGLVDEEMDLINRDIGKLAAILIDDTVDEHVMSFRKLSVDLKCRAALVSCIRNSLNNCRNAIAKNLPFPSFPKRG